MPVSWTPVGRFGSCDLLPCCLRPANTVSAPTLSSIRVEAQSLHLRSGLQALCLRFNLVVAFQLARLDTRPRSRATSTGLCMPRGIQSRWLCRAPRAHMLYIIRNLFNKINPIVNFCYTFCSCCVEKERDLFPSGGDQFRFYGSTHSVAGFFILGSAVLVMTGMRAHDSTPSPQRRDPLVN